MVGFAERAPLIGRQQELELLEQLLDRAGAGAGGVALLSGEPGVGKSRLLGELAAQARVRGWTVLAGRAYDSEGLPPYVPFVEALRPYLRSTPSATLAAQLGEGLDAVSLLLPELRRRLRGLGEREQRTGDRGQGTESESGHTGPFLSGHSAGAEGGVRPDAYRTQSSVLSPQPSSDRYHLFEAVADFLFSIAGSGPKPSPGLLLVLDDLQWADRSALLLLLHVARRLAQERLPDEQTAPILVAGAYRSVELEHGHPLISILGDLRREHLAERLTLAALDALAVPRLIKALSGVLPAAEVSEAILRVSGGNAFFIEEAVRHLLAEGHDLTEARTARVDWGVPQGVREVLERRLGRLRAIAVQLLQGVAVLGDGYPFDVLADTSDVAVEPLLDALEEVLAAGILREDGTSYHFSHDLIRQAVLMGLSAPRRQRLHLRAGLALEQGLARGLGTDAAAALHFRQAGPEGWGPALVYGRRAAEAATRVYAWEEAVVHCRTALGLPGVTDDTQRCELLLALVEAQTRAGDDDDARDTWRQAASLARTLHDPASLARAALGLGRMLVASVTVDGERVAVLEEALDALGEADPTLRVRLLSSLVQALVRSGAGERITALSEEALLLARRLGDPAMLADALDARHNALRGSEHLNERLDLSREMVRLAILAGDSEQELRTRLRQMRDLLEAGDMPAVDAEIAVLDAKASELRQPHVIWRTRLAQGMRSTLSGDLPEAERLAQEAIAVGSRAHVWEASLFFHVQTALIWAEHGALDQAVPAWEAALAPLPKVFVGRCALAWLYCECGQMEQARQELDRLVPAGVSTLQRDSQNWLASLSLLAQVCARLDDQAHAAELYEPLLPYAERQPCLATAVAVFGSAHRYLGLLAATLGNREEAARHFEAALARNEGLGARVWLAHTQLDYARMLLTRPHDSGLGTEDDRRERARDLLDQALTTAEELGLTRLGEQVRQLTPRPARRTQGRGLRNEVGEHAPLSPQSSVLSPREAEVLALLAAGRTSQEIAGELTLALRTVHRHLANIYAKIGARGRVEATAYAFSHGLARPPEP